MSTRKHLAKLIGLAVMAALVISAFASASASAATWTVEGAKLGEGTANGVPAHASLKSGASAMMRVTLLGKKFAITAATFSSLGGTIFQEGTRAKASGVLEFSGLTVHEPAGCTVEAPIKTKALTGELVDHSGSSLAYAKFVPEEGEVFTTLKISGCAIAGSYNLKGVVYGQGEEWGKELKFQPLKFSPTINSTLGGSFTAGSNSAELFMESENTLASGKSFSVDT